MRPAVSPATSGRTEPVAAEAGPALWRQTWHDLAFLHWRVEPSQLRPLVPEPLAIDTFDGSAWVAVTPFWMSGVTLRGLPAVPGLSTFPEMNVRTYVQLDGRPGVRFFSLDAANRLAVAAARRLYHLPYVHARMRVGRTGPGIRYTSRRRDGRGFVAEYAPSGPAQQSAPGREYFLTERYCLYARSARGTLYRADIDHEPWPLQPATAAVERNDMLAANGITVHGEPLAHFARRLDVLVWPLRKV